MKPSLFGGALLIGLAWVAPAGTGSRVTLRLVNSAKVPPATLRLGQKRAAQVLSQAGIEVFWQDCSAGEVGACAGQLEASEFWLHVANWKPAGRSAEMLGFTVLDGHTPAGTGVAGVYYPKVREMATSFQVEEGDVLGAALAHEIGHLLGLSHAPTGVMRTRFNRQCIVELSQGGLLFGKGQARQIRAAAKSRMLPRIGTVRNGNSGSLYEQPR